ncbi:MAG: phosphomannomutase/phosphoglucomutase, partial [Acidimicrobiales bacterium]
MPPLDAIFKAYDIRGVVPDELDAGVCRRIGASFARFAAAPRVLMARDMRGSGVELSAAFADGVTSQGCDVLDLGLGSTDLLYFAAGWLDAPGAMFTASHNPARYNGVKLCLAGARPVGQDTGLAQVKAGAAELLPPAGGQRGTVSRRVVLGDFADHVRSFVDLDALRPLTVVADAANGMGGLVAPAVFAGLPFDVEMLYPELDGSFPNHPPDPIQPENLKDLQARVLDRQADIGLAFDGDADRVFLVDERAQPVSGSLTTALVAKALLARHPGEKVGYNLICSKSVPEVIAESGGIPVRTRVGHSFIKSVMADTGAVFAGEHSGHYYFRDNYRADSGLIAALIVLELLSTSGRPLSELVAPLDRYSASGELNRQVADPPAVVERVAAAFVGASQDRVDGLTVDLGDWWFNLRPSNTEPLLRLNLEAATPDACRQRTAEVLTLIEEAGRG